MNDSVERWRLPSGRCSLLAAIEGILQEATMLVVCAVLVLTALPGSPQATTAEANRIAELNYFVGRWECAGKFVASGKSIEANLEFEPILDGHFIVFCHDDKPPHRYHAWAEWGWDGESKRFVSTVQDSFAASMRLFYASGWDGVRSAWEGGALGKDADQQFLS